MAYRNGIYVAFAADGNTDITKSDIKYYNLMKLWNLMKNRDFQFINPHEKGAMLRSGSKEATIKATLRDRLDNSKLMILLVGNTTKLDTDFVPYELQYAISSCDLPIVVCYVNERSRITQITPRLRQLWPKILADSIDDGTTHTIHIPFRQRILNQALNQFNLNNRPSYHAGYFTDAAYDGIYKPGEI
ncbi:TIR domain-containing protein [Flavobacterium psychrophilum]|uniref:TIR domain-containing protein n=1 Tax=Flavobacterium psychrophilum TaxID=96345 RepID=UPI000B7C3F23|nr:TIR domain-containing protein [Flavobacterium psychrophilum]MCB6070250.1 TIR domain-containing protein [Flavobacterium psychrophilum]MCB6107735.1 TIR domain-containing protein [Flavobacterium psychrophilum]SNA85135.1 conserved hypothetical protein [Flavobacterium psychrophilum]SNB06309.1 conserved hypothetical protein [Flavobacterium psychrophilum]